VVRTLPRVPATRDGGTDMMTNGKFMPDKVFQEAEPCSHACIAFHGNWYFGELRGVAVVKSPGRPAFMPGAVEGAYPAPPDLG